MKLYKYYLILPDNTSVLKEKFGDSVLWYFNELKGMLNTMPKYYNFESDNWYYLYAFTNDKVISNNFEKLHDIENLFVKKENKVSKEEYEAFRCENLGSELTDWELLDKEGFIKIYAIRNEKGIMTDILDMDYYSVFDTMAFINYKVFKSKYIEALDKIFYCTFKNLLSTNYDDIEIAEDRLSMGSSYEGYIDMMAGYSLNELGIYLLLFELILVKGE